MNLADSTSAPARPRQVAPAGGPVDHRLGQMSPIARVSVVGEAIERLKTLIVEGHVQPGERLPAERKLAELLGISRPALREATRALGLLGVLDIRHGDGTYVSRSAAATMGHPLSFALLRQGAALLDFLELRKINEVAIAGLAARRRTAADLAAIESELEAMKRSLGQPETYIAHELAFHEAIIAAAHNPLLGPLMRTLNDLFREGRRQTILGTDRLDLSWLEHEAIHAAIKRGALSRAQAAMLRHLEHTEERVQRLLQSSAPRPC